MLYILVKALPRVQYGKNSTGRGRAANITRGEAECYISLETKPECILHSWQCFNWFIVLAGLFEKIAKVLLGAMEWQVTQKVRSLALADHSKAVCPC